VKVDAVATSATSRNETESCVESSLKHVNVAHVATFLKPTQHYPYKQCYADQVSHG